jgi:hypothetical protein
VYAASRDGKIYRVATAKGPITPREVKGFVRRKSSKNAKLTGCPHLAVTLSMEGVKKLVYVHNLVAEAWLGPRPEIDDRPAVVDHVDTNPQNNAVSNLEYVSIGENNRRFYAKSTKMRAIRTRINRRNK